MELISEVWETQTHHAVSSLGRHVVSVIILRGVKHTSGFSTNSSIFQFFFFFNYLNLTSELLKLQLTQ